MSELLAARSQMAMSLAFHILFSCVGMAMPLLMSVAEWRWLRTGDKAYLDLAKRWSSGTIVLFVVGAVSGTVLSFELGLLWPTFMDHAGPIIGMPFSLEGFAFFLEAIFLGIYIYGWDRISPRAHWLAGVMVLVSGSMSGVFVVTANAWMNAPTGFRFDDGVLVDVDPWAAMMNPAAFGQVVHMVLAAFVAVSFAVAGLHAYRLLRMPSSLFDRCALSIALPVAIVTAFIQPATGDLVGQAVARNQPIKLAAMEGQWETMRGAPLRIGGWPDERAEVTRYALELPYLLSLLTYHDGNAEIQGLKAFPADERPPVAIVHIAFQLMIFAGAAMAFVAFVSLILFRQQGGLPTQPWFLRLLVLVGPLGFVAVEAGWVVTEVGRQPWVIYGFMKTADALTPMTGLVVPFAGFALLYLFLSVSTVHILRRVVLAPETGWSNSVAHHDELSSGRVA